MISDMRHWLAGVILLAASTPAQAETSASEFLGLASDRQAAATVGDVLRLLKESPNESRSPVPWAVTRAVTKRC